MLFVQQFLYLSGQESSRTDTVSSVASRRLVDGRCNLFALTPLDTRYSFDNVFNVSFKALPQTIKATITKRFVDN